MTDNKLIETLRDEQRDELGEVDSLAQMLDAYDVPEPDTAQLLAALHAQRETLDERQSADMPDAVEVARWQPQPTQGMRYWLRVARSQTTFLEPAWWLTSGMVLLLGMSIILWQGSEAALWLVTMAAPLMTALSTAYFFRPTTQTMLELERISPLNITELVYARLVLVLGLHVILVCGLLSILWSGDRTVPTTLWRLLIIWLGPMLGLSGVALYASIRWNALVGALLPLACWGSWVLLSWQAIAADAAVPIHAADFNQYLLLAINQSDEWLGVSLLALLGGIIIIWDSGRVVQRQSAA